MTINKMTDVKHVIKQYKNDESLNIRKSFHKKYSINSQSYASWLYNKYALTSNSKILELGSGNGDFWQAHMKDLSKTTDIVLSDFSQGMIDLLKEKYSNLNIKIKQIDIQSIPYEDESFDVVIANAMLYHVPNISKAVKEVHRVLKPGGKFYASTFGENGLLKFINDSLSNMDLSINQMISNSFTLQNGSNILSACFNKVERIDYLDGLRVTKEEDIVNYIYSMTSMNGLRDSDKKPMLEYFLNLKNDKGIIEIPKEYGLFISTK